MAIGPLARASARASAFYERLVSGDAGLLLDLEEQTVRAQCWHCVRGGCKNSDYLRDGGVYKMDFGCFAGICYCRDYGTM